MPDAHPLDRPVWSALTSGWADLAEGDAKAWRLKRDYGVFGAAADRSPASLAALATLIPLSGELWMLEREEWPSPPQARLLRSAACAQMIAESILPGPSLACPIVPLSEDDAPAMFALATLTRPGPYVPHTNRLGAFIGIKEDGRLIAMAGERMRIPGFAEVSGVCTHPDYRGRGYAGALMRQVSEAMIARDETPFLHAYASNGGAIALYESLGFTVRASVIASVIERDI